MRERENYELFTCWTHIVTEKTAQVLEEWNSIVLRLNTNHFHERRDFWPKTPVKGSYLNTHTLTHVWYRTHRYRKAAPYQFKYSKTWWTRRNKTDFAIQCELITHFFSQTIVFAKKKKNMCTIVWIWIERSIQFYSQIKLFILGGCCICYKL